MDPSENEVEEPVSDTPKAADGTEPSTAQDVNSPSIESLLREKKELEEKLQKHGAISKQLQERFRRTIEEREKELAEVKEALKDKDSLIQSLQQQKSELESSNESLQKEALERTTEIENLKKDLETQKALLEESNSKITVIEAELNTFKESTTTERKDGVKEDASSSSEAKAESVVDSLLDLMDSNAPVEQEEAVKELEQEARVDSLLDELVGESEEASDKDKKQSIEEDLIHEIKTFSSSSTSDKDEMTEASLAIQLAEKEDAIKKLNAEIQRLSEEFAKSNAETAKLSEDFTKLNEDVAKLKNELNEKTQELQVVQSNYSEVSEKLSSVTSQMLDNTSQFEAKKSSYEKRIAQLTEATVELSSLKEELGKMTEKLETEKKRTSELNLWKAKFEAEEKQRKKLESQLEEIKRDGFLTIDLNNDQVSSPRKEPPTPRKTNSQEATNEVTTPVSENAESATSINDTANTAEPFSNDTKGPESAELTHLRNVLQIREDEQAVLLAKLKEVAKGTPMEQEVLDFSEKFQQNQERVTTKREVNPSPHLGIS
jgi:chromosome segregation ATPase